MAEHVVDASVVIAILFQEPGADSGLFASGAAAISSVNLSEIVARLADRGDQAEDIRSQVESLGLETMVFDESLAFDAGLLRPATRFLGLSLGDRACLALARRMGLPAVTADRAWGQLAIGIEIHVTR